MEHPDHPPTAPSTPDDGAPPSAPAKSSTQATVALVVAIVGLFFFGLILGGLSIYLGYRAVREIDASGGRLTGRRRAVAAQIIGAIAFVLWAIGIVLNVAAGS